LTEKDIPPRKKDDTKKDDATSKPTSKSKK